MEEFIKAIKTGNYENISTHLDRDESYMNLLLNFELESPLNSTADKISPLATLIILKHEKIIDIIFKSYFDVLEIDLQDINGNTALMYASVMGNRYILNLLLIYGADDSIINEDGYTAAFLALKYNKIDNLVTLLRHNKELADYQNWKGHTLLIQAVIDKQETFVSSLTDYTDTNIKGGEDGTTALMEAVINNSLVMTKIILSNEKTEIDLRDDVSGLTALMYASMNGFTNIVQLLLKKKANIYEEDFYGETAFMKASENGHLPIAKLLIRDEYINSQNFGGDTALIKSILENHINIVNFLLRRNADMYITNDCGENAFDIAKNKGVKEILELLLEYKKPEKKLDEIKAIKEIILNNDLDIIDIKKDIHGYNFNCYENSKLDREENIMDIDEDNFKEPGLFLRGIFEINSKVNSLEFSCNNKFICAGCDDNTVKIWFAESGELIRNLKGHKSIVTSVSFSNNGEYICSGSLDKDIIIWDFGTGKEIKTLKQQRGGILSVCFSRDDMYICSGGKDAIIRIWEIEAGEQIKILEGHTKDVTCVKFFGNDNYLCSSSYDDTVRIWDVENSNEIFRLIGYSSNSLSISNDCRYICYNTFFGLNIKKYIMVIVDLKNGIIKKIAGNGNWNTTLSGNGRYICAAKSNNIRFWHTDLDYKEIEELNMESEAINKVSFSVDGKYICCNSNEYRNIKIWKVNSPYSDIDSFEDEILSSKKRKPEDDSLDIRGLKKLKKPDGIHKNYKYRVRKSSKRKSSKRKSSKRKSFKRKSSKRKSSKRKSSKRN
jgi:WD40 repeat protein